ncbi:RNA polymerase primary sigma factor [Breznakibacter xylanolyticus]|uniref:RNA polymerase primary sigma factor n=1 Tax=Breznakibacter xylanolyticus TaxID=990 RepID=A0A2W7MXF6_9BACT|nr:RNA polymerase sigma factor RpoD/SigA [Breznakibacter xylanolyticus]MBN2743889.1 sigma-70 family RNA polymerase sigma factor [Marinilabiliaceae bacterium]PZX12341.1 RNA polymerase primary sigma factor [Breznakibacter xylanolyticus]
MRQLKITKQVTNRETPALDKYLHEIGKVKLISTDEEVGLAKLIRQGDAKSLERLVNSNLRFVVSVAKQYQNQGLTLSDLINEGNLGLIKAAQRFDETRGFKFISYAVWWIRQSILQALAEQARIVRLPLNKIGAINKVNNTFARLEQEFQREPTSDEIADVLQIAAGEVKDALKVSSRHVSMDAPLKRDEDNTLYDILLEQDTESPDAYLLSDSLRKEIDRCLSTLSHREADIIRLYYGLSNEPPYSLEEIGKLFNLTRERVRQIKEKGIKRLKHTYRSKVLRSYLGQ